MADCKPSAPNGARGSSLKLVVLTDLHLVPDGDRIIGIDPGARLRQALDHIGRHHRDADRLVVTGDLTHYGDAASYEQLATELDRAVVPVTLLLGNHDRREAFKQVFPSAAVDDHGFVQGVDDLHGWRLVHLDTLHGPPYEHPHVHAGHLCPRRLAWLDATLADAGQRPVLLFMHHPPHAVGFAGMDTIRLRDEAAFFDVLERHGNVRHIVAGHIYRTISGTVRGIPFSVFKSPVHQQPMDFDSLDTSSSVAEPGAYGLLFAREDAILVHTEDYTLSAP
jgi:3',5'-cyclic-AMP phosphodiesterase